MTALELLAPARNADIGIAAVDCGADAVYIGGPGFGARKDAGNSLEEVARLCSYAHRFGVKVFMTVNVALRDGELPEVHSIMLEAQQAGVDAFIIRDERICSWKDITVPLHASTQCAIRTPQRAAQLEALGCSRLVLERELSLEQIRQIRSAVGCELEFFVHGALCVCYSGECRLSERINGRSADRGECIQACRSLYDLVDESGKVLVKGKALLSLKDFKLKNRLEELADEGIMSFKIEGRLKNASYVKNVTREYSDALDEIVAKYPDRFRRSSLGHPEGGFRPDSNKTFNRGYTELYLDGRRSRWSSMDTAKSVGEKIGVVGNVGSRSVELKFFAPGTVLHNGDGFAFASTDGLCGFRADTASGNVISCRVPQDLRKGMTLYRNLSAAFEKEIESNACRRFIPASIDASLCRNAVRICARREDGACVSLDIPLDGPVAENPDRTLSMLRSGLAKRSGIYSFSLNSLERESGNIPLVSSAQINAIRARLAEELEKMPAVQVAGDMPAAYPSTSPVNYSSAVSDSSSVNGNSLSSGRTADNSGRAIQGGQRDIAAEPLMRTKYCIKYELGLCPKHFGTAPTGRLYLLNNGRRIALHFDCRSCEMTLCEE